MPEVCHTPFLGPTSRESNDGTHLCPSLVAPCWHGKHAGSPLDDGYAKTMTPGPEDLWFLPLGGCGEIGMNLNLFGTDDRWLMVDCGITFEDTVAGNQIQMPDPSFITERAEKLVGIIITHAHLDHIGALPYLAAALNATIFTTPFTARVLRPKLRERGCQARVVEVPLASSQTLGPFHVHWLPITHSTPETHALLIETSVGRILHTADWKIDAQPVVGDGFDITSWQGFREPAVNALVCDSTNALQGGHSVSEADLESGLLDHVKEASGRVAVGCFASNIARLQTLGRVAKNSGRYLCLLGRSLDSMVIAAKSAGYLTEDFDPIPAKDIGYLPPSEVMMVTTGSQGEPGAALTRLAANTHPLVELDPGDTVIFSAKAIPGNEAKIQRLITGFSAHGVRVVVAEGSNKAIHASGHPNAEELASLYTFMQPELAIPVHGELPHMEENAALAKRCGVKRQLVGKNGDLFRIAPTPSLLRNAVAVGRLAVDKRGQLSRIS